MPLEVLTAEELRHNHSKACQAGYEDDYETWLNDRFTAKTNLFWLAKSVLGYELVDNYYCPTHPLNQSETQDTCHECGKQFEQYPGGYEDATGLRLSPHREMCGFFIKKNPNESISNQSRIKDRLIMCPRGSFKSSIDEADCVQWMIAFPDIRIALLTATEDLGTAFVEKVKSFFLIDLDEDGKLLKPFTKFQLLFPEHILPAKKKGAADRFITPARKKYNKEPSLWAISLKAATSGLHFEVGKYDDCVSNSNSGPGTSQDQRESVRQQIDLARSLIDPIGYHDNIGTPYDEQDAYAHQQSHAIAGTLQVMIRAAWKLKKTAIKKQETELGEHDYNLFFPWYVKSDSGEITPWQTYGFLRGKQHTDLKIFCCQYLCNPATSRLVNFTEDLIRSHITQAEGLPLLYRAFSAWDLAYSDEKGRDYTVGVVGWIDDQNRLFIMDIIRKRFSKGDHPPQIAKMAAKWRVEKIGIEDSPGANFLENDIRRKLAENAYADCTIEFFPVDATKGAKNTRAELLETLLKNDSLWFSSEIGIMGQVIEEFKNFKPSSKRKDDVIDAIAHVARYIPTTVIIPKSEQERQADTNRILAEKQLRDSIFAGPADPTPVAETLSQPTQWEGMPIFQNTDEQIYGT